jgi:hypothetical protein
MIKFNVEKRWSTDIAFTAEIDCRDNAALSSKLRLAILWAIKNNANLSGANLSGADLSWANLSGADLSWANLSWANLSGADLSAANLLWANLSGANLSGANLSAANLSGANLSGADLSAANLSIDVIRLFKHDLWRILLQYKAEIEGLKKAIVGGKINGSVYSGECSCLMGTIAKVKHCDVNSLIQDASSPAEQWFLQIQEGQTPKNHGPSRMALEWIEEFEELMK